MRLISFFAKIYWSVVLGIKNLWTYRKLIWHTRNYDGHYLLEFMSFKLREMQKDFAKTNVLVGTDSRIWEMHKVELVLERLIKEEYQTLEYMQFNKERANIIAHKKPFVLQADVKKILSDNLMHNEYMIAQDIDFLGTLLRKYYRNWWY